MDSKHVHHFSVGALVFFLLGFIVLGACLVGGAVIIANHQSYKVEVVAPSELPKGELGPLSEAIISQKMSANEMEDAFGPLNKKALAETKQGWLLDRIRARRGGSCQSQYVQYQSQPTYRQVRYSYPQVNSCSPCTTARVVRSPIYPSYPSPAQPLPSPTPTNPMVPVSPVDIVPSVPRTPTPDISSLPEGIVPSVASSYCEDGSCPWSTK